MLSTSSYYYIYVRITIWHRKVHLLRTVRIIAFMRVFELVVGLVFAPANIYTKVHVYVRELTFQKLTVFMIALKFVHTTSIGSVLVFATTLRIGYVSMYVHSPKFAERHVTEQVLIIAQTVALVHVYPLPNLIVVIVDAYKHYSFFLYMYYSAYSPFFLVPGLYFFHGHILTIVFNAIHTQKAFVRTYNYIAPCMRTPIYTHLLMYLSTSSCTHIHSCPHMPR